MIPSAEFAVLADACIVVQIVLLFIVHTLTLVCSLLSNCPRYRYTFLDIPRFLHVIFCWTTLVLGAMIHPHMLHSTDREPFIRSMKFIPLRHHICMAMHL